MSNMKILGFSFQRSSSDDLKSPIPKDDDSSIKVDSAPGFISPQVTSIALDNLAATENEFISKYRETSMIPEVNMCVEEIVSEAVIVDKDDMNVTLDLDRIKFTDNIKNRINEEFEEVYDLLMFGRKGHDIFKKWYVDGRLNYQAIIDPDDTKQGIQALRFIDPRKIKRVREAEKEVDSKTGTITIKSYKEYFLYNERGVGSVVQQPGAQPHGLNVADTPMTKESIIYVPSGIVEPNLGYTISYLHHAIRTANNLRMMEDSMLIYRLVRAPERRVFYIDTGNLPKAKAAQYVQEIADKNKTKVVYDVSTGEIRNDKKFMAMTEDYWIPRKEGSKGTEIETLPGGEQVGETGEAEYYKNKLFTALNVPKSRFAEQPSLFSSGTTVTRDEVRFSRFISQLRGKFIVLFEEILGRQLVLKGVMTANEWDEEKGKISYNFAEDSHFAEALKQEKLESRADLLSRLDPFVGKYISREYVYKEVFCMTDEEMKEEMKKSEGDRAWAQSFMPEPIPTNESFQPSSSDELLENLNEIKASEMELNQALTDFVRSQAD